MFKILLSITMIAMALNAHFLTLIPDDDTVRVKEGSRINFEISFMHPFEQEYMDMEEPNGFYVNTKNEKIAIKPSLKDGHKIWLSSYQLGMPGVYKFFLDPKPYFEPAEGKFIHHIPKVMVSAYGMDDGWDKPIGLKYEIVPLTKPFGLYSGNTFQGFVLKDGKPLPNCEVEVEFYNDKGFIAPTPAHITQVVKTDPNGIFTFTPQRIGWWGFAALIEEGTIKKDAREYPVENGALLWIKVY